MVGRRVAVPPSGGINDVWPDMEPGDYCGPIVGYTGPHPAVFFLLPVAREPGAHPCVRGLQHVCCPPHTFRECPDGSLEIRESIGSICSCEPKQDGFAWHGYLDEGNVWREC